ncbi:MAG: 5-oxoprolinase [Candidatus Hecatellales archaeon B24]|nr:MAG: 5-oxoprolinase [Candidatus Hecatellales archaeon B24]
MYYTSSGGGGFGDPRERDPELVLKDVMDGWISLECARNVYGVVINVIDEEACAYEVDQEATKKLREELKKNPLPEGLGSHQVHPLGKKIKPKWIPTYEEVLPYVTLARPPGW